jgi:hypothetical protein
MKTVTKEVMKRADEIYSDLCHKTGLPPYMETHIRSRQVKAAIMAIMEHLATRNTPKLTVKRK